MLPFQRKNSKKASKGSEGLPSDHENLQPAADRVMALSQGADGTRPPSSSIFSKLERRFRNISTSNEATSHSQQSSSNNEKRDESDTVKETPSQGDGGKTTSKPRDLGINKGEESQSLSTSEGSERASTGSQGLPSDHETLKQGADGATAVLQGTDGTRPPSTNIFSKLERRFRKRQEETNGSQRRSSINENLDESKTDKDTPREGAPGKITFKPKDLSINMEEESQSWSISEGDGPAELLEVCWLDVNGSMIATKGKTYEISFKLSMNKQKSFGWEDPVSVMAKMGEEGKYECVKVDLSQLGEDQKVFPSEKFRIEFKSDENTGNKETKLYFGLYEVWTNKWKGGLRIHEAIVQEVTAEDSASTSNTCPEESNVLEVTADNSTSTSSNPGQFHNSASNSSSQRVGSSEIVPDSASTSNNHLNDLDSASHEEEEYRDKQNKVEDRKF